MKLKKIFLFTTEELRLVVTALRRTLPDLQDPAEKAVAENLIKELKPDLKKKAK